MSYCPLFKIRFPDFSHLCFHISEWKLVASFHMKSYRSSSTFIMVDLLFHELLPFVQNSFSGLFSAMLSHSKFDAMQWNKNTLNWRSNSNCSFFKKCTDIMAADLNLLGSVGDLYCFSNTLSMLVNWCGQRLILERQGCIHISSFRTSNDWRDLTYRAPNHSYISIKLITAKWCI